MEQVKWLCLNCDESDECACFEAKDILDLPDITIVYSHAQKSPTCKPRRVYFTIATKIYELEERRQIRREPDSNLQHDTSPIGQRFSVSPDVTDVMLKLIELNEKKIAIIGIAAGPAQYTNRFKETIVRLGREEGIFVYEEIPSNIEALSSLPLPRRAKNQEHIVVFVGAGDAWARWETMLKKHRKFSLLHRSIGFAI